MLDAIILNTLWILQRFNNELVFFFGVVKSKSESIFDMCVLLLVFLKDPKVDARS